MHTQGRRESRESRKWLDQEVEEIGEKKQLNGPDIRLPTSSKIVQCQLAWLPEQHAEALEDTPVDMKQTVAGLMEEVLQRIVEVSGRELPAGGAVSRNQGRSAGDTLILVTQWSASVRAIRRSEKADCRLFTSS